MTLTSELAAISTPSTRPGPPPADARYSVIAANTITLNAQPHMKSAPELLRVLPRASRYEWPSMASKPVDSITAKNQPKPAANDSNTKDAPSANKVPMPIRQRKLDTCALAAANIEGS